MVDIKKKKKIYSIWDDDIDYEKVQDLSPKQKGKYFPNDYDSKGKPYGDF